MTIHAERERERERRAVAAADGRQPRPSHSPLGPLGFMFVMAVPVAIAIIAIVVEGWDAISWGAAVLWGFVATVVFTMFGKMGSAMGMTRMDILDLLGSVAARPKTAAAQTVGFGMHHMNGIILAIAWAFGVALVGLPANWWTGLLWALILTGLTYVMLGTVGSVHPAIKRGEQEDPGFAGTRLGRMTPMGSLIGHLVYGGTLGALYNAFPLT